MDAIRHPQFGLVSHFMADVGPGMLQQRANLNLGLQSQDFRRNGDRDAGVPKLLRIDHDDVMHRAVAELGGTQSLAHVLAVGPVDVERLLDELAHRPHLIRSLRDDAPAAEVRHAGQGIGGQCAFRMHIELAFAEDLLRETGDALGTRLDQGQRRKSSASLLENRLQKLRVEKVTGADCHESWHLQCYPVLIRQGRPFLDFFPRLSHLSFAPGGLRLTTVSLEPEGSPHSSTRLVDGPPGGGGAVASDDLPKQRRAASILGRIGAPQPHRP